MLVHHKWLCGITVRCWNYNHEVVAQISVEMLLNSYYCLDG